MKKLMLSTVMTLLASILYSQTEAKTVPQLVIDAKSQLDASYTKETALKIENELLPLEEQISSSEIKNLNDAYYSLLIDCRVLSDDWRAVPQLYSRLLEPDNHSTYLAAASYYKAQEYIIAEKLLKEIHDDSVSAQGDEFLNAKILYAQVLALRGKYKDSLAVYTDLDKNNLLDSKNRLEFSKVLFLQKKYAEASEQAAKSQLPASDYICGLCQFMLKNYDSAADFFKVYSIKNPSAPDSVYSDYYYALSLYRLASYKNAASVFEKVASSKKALELVFKSYNYAAKAFVLAGDFSQAGLISEKMIRAAGNTAERQDAVIFASEIYSDSQNYKKAVSILESYTSAKDDFAARCNFLKAGLLNSDSDFAGAVAAYKNVYENFTASSYSEEALFRCGEIYYSHQDLKNAELSFTKYLYDYPSGEFADGAYYFSGECNLKNGNLNRSIMQNKNLLEKYPASVYAYNGGKNLMEAYYKQESYTEALETARLLVKNYRVQANSDGLGKRLIELEQIEAGTDRRIVEKKSEYEKAGSLSSKTGRILGTELVQLYEKYGTHSQAVTLALSLVEKQDSSDEASYGAQNAEFLAQNYSKISEQKLSADFYLKAAAFYRTAGNSAKAAASLYSAADAFVQSSMKGDAKECADLLLQLYPDTRQAKKVMSLLD